MGTENPMPPRTADRAIPPAEMLQDLGLKVNDMIYHYSGHAVNWGEQAFTTFSQSLLRCFIA